MSEELLAQKAAKGDSLAFEELLRAYEKRVYNMALKMTANPDDAADLTQEAFIRVWRSLKDFKGDSKFSTWLFRIVSNLCADHARRQSRRKETPLIFGEEDDAYEYEPPDERFEPERELSQKELREELDAAIASLGDDHREIFLMREVYDLSYAEIGEALGLEEGTVKSRLHRTRQKLREFLLARGNIPESFASKGMKGDEKR